MVDGTFKVGTQRLGVRANSEEIGEWIGHALGAYRMRRWVYPQYSVVVGDPGEKAEAGGRRYNIVYSSLTPLVRTFDLETLGRTFLSEMESNVLGRRRDALYLRGAVMSLDGITGLVPGWVVSHLATMGRRAERLGITLPGEAWVAVDPGTGTILPKPNVLDVPDDALPALRELAGSNGHRDRTFVEEPNTVDVVFTYGEGAEPFAPVSRGLALHRLTASAANVERMGAAALRGLRAMVAGARTVSFDFLRAREMVDGIAGVLGERRAA